MAESVKVGDTVQLRSGGPSMTVNGHLRTGMLSCSWFGVHSELCNGTFAPAALKVVAANTQDPE